MTTTALITSRAEFFRTLDITRAEVDDLVARQPTYSVWGVLQRQLQAMKEWSADGDPTPEERAKISIGLVAARELEPPATPAMDALIDRLHLLNYARKHWPPGSG
jgi:hypothetical protein